jgi:hypothetical protein
MSNLTQSTFFVRLVDRRGSHLYFCSVSAPSAFDAGVEARKRFIAERPDDLAGEYRGLVIRRMGQI